MFYNDAKKEALSRLEDVERRYKLNAELANDAALSLYGSRKLAAKAISRVQDYVNVLANSPKEFRQIVADVVISIAEFNEAVRLEEDNFSTNVKAGGTAASGIALGGAVAMMGPTAAMAIATTFGTASTGTAIAALSGAAAKGAALAWLGGGALAAGGGGMAAGNALLALAGPVGWGAAALLAGGAAGYKIWKNKDIADKANHEAQRGEEAIAKFTAKIAEMNGLISTTDTLRRSIALDIFNTYPNDYMSFSTEQKTALCAVVNNTQSLGRYINERIHV